MSQVSKISVALTPELAALVNQAVETGDHATRDQMRQLWAEGIASGPGRFGDLAAIKAEARRRLLEENRKSAD